MAQAAPDAHLVNGKPTKAPPKDAKSHLDENSGNDGSNVSRGDMHTHRCTDVLFLGVFILFLLGMVYILQYAAQNGDPRRLTHGFDWKGELCGVGANVTAQPYLYYCGVDDTRVDGFPTKLNLKAPVCVAACPDAADVSIACLGSRTSQTTYTGVDPYITQTEVITSVVTPQWSYPTRALAGMYCIPDISLSDYAENLTQDLLSSDGPLGNVVTRGMQAVGSMRRCPYVLLGAMCMAIVLGAVYLFLLREVANFLVQAVLAILCVGLLAAGCVCLGGFIFKTVGQDEALESWQDKNPLYAEYDADTAYMYSTVAGCIFMGLFLVSFCAICCCKSAIDTAVGCVQAACECMFSMPSLLVQPVLESICKMGIAGFLLYGFTWLVSSGEVTTSDIVYGDTELAGLRRHFTYADNVEYMILYYILGFFWLMEITTSISQFVISYSVAVWYYTPNPKAGKVPHVPLVKGLAICVFFHLGTVALGAFLIALCRLTRLILSAIAEHSKEQGNQTCACIASCLACCVRCFEDFLKQINKNAYIDVCLSSNDFCTAASNSFKFMVSHGAEVIFLNGACFIFTVAGSAFISFFTAFIWFNFITSIERWTANDSQHYVESPEFVAFICGVLALGVAHTFMTVFDHTADTLLYVYVWNKTHGHNTVQKYATGKLKDLTGYKPKAKQSEGSSHGGVFSTFTSFFGSDHSHSDETKPLMKH